MAKAKTQTAQAAAPAPQEVIRNAILTKTVKIGTEFRRSGYVIENVDADFAEFLENASAAVFETVGAVAVETVEDDETDGEDNDA
jgi:hypothetical protein